MKKIATFIYFLWLLAGGVLSARTPDGEREFMIRGEIAGLAVGDTLRFERIEPSEWSLAPDFDVVVTTPDGFEYTGRKPHVQYYMMTYSPVAGKAPESSMRGLTMIVDTGTVTVTGTASEIYFSRIDGEAFGEQPLLREVTELENSMQQERSRFLRQARAAYAAGDSIQAREYERQFNELRQDDDQKRIEALENEFLQRHPSSPWSLIYRLGRSSRTPVDTLEAYYATLDAPARSGYLGTLLREKIDEQKRLLPGQQAPAFQATLPDGTVMDSEEFRGKYLLIYHWGFCPGSIQREKDATELYNRFREHVEVLGITPSLDAIREAARTTPSDAKMLGIELKPVYESMAAHPWIDVEQGTDGNHRIGKLYAFAGFPYFILVSPDGKIVSRGFHDTFFEAKKILESQIESP